MIIIQEITWNTHRYADNSKLNKNYAKIQQENWKMRSQEEMKKSVDNSGFNINNKEKYFSFFTKCSETKITY